jgi:hypothetical protein
MRYLISNHAISWYGARCSRMRRYVGSCSACSRLTSSKERPIGLTSLDLLARRFVMSTHPIKIDKTSRARAQPPRGRGALRCVVAGGPWWLARRRAHTILEVLPALAGDPFLDLRNDASSLLKDMKEHEQVLRTAVQHSVELTPIVAAQLTKLSVDLRTARKG